MQILVTNDDGPESPFVAPLVRAAAAIGSVTVVLPHCERSWTAKAMTRFTDLRLAPYDFSGEDVGHVSGFTLEGTPADCVNAGCYHISPRLPDLVLSGVNAGENTGVAYMASSGTIGACLEANIATVPAIAFSQQLSENAFANWTSRVPANPGTELGGAVDRLERVLPVLLADLVSATRRPKEQGKDQLSTWSVNIPWQIALDWKVVPCSLDRTRYGSCFERHGEVLRHVGAPAILSSDDGADVNVLADGCISLTRIDLWSFGQEIAGPISG